MSCPVPHLFSPSWCRWAVLLLVAGFAHATSPPLGRSCDVDRGWLSWPSNGAAAKPMPCRLAKEVATLIPRDSHAHVERVDVFHIHTPRAAHAQQQIFWGWRKSACGGLRDKYWRTSNGRAMGPTLQNEVHRLDSIGMLRGGGVAIDIGAHMGDSTLPMALLANRTIAFEPNPLVYASLTANARLNPALNIEAHNLGISSSKGVLTFSYGGKELCNGGVTGAGGSTAGSQSVQLPVEPLGPFLERTYGAELVSQIRYIKTDAEGYDAEIVDSIVPLVALVCARARRCPTLQVEWFAGFVATSQPAVSAGSRRLFSALGSLPHGPWELMCTAQSNTPGIATTSSGASLVPIPGPHRRHYCPDIIARPASTSAPTA